MPTGTKPAKPYASFPLTAHNSGQWSKKIKQKVYYFGPWADHQAAHAKYLTFLDQLQAGRSPKLSVNTTPAPGVGKPTGATLKELVQEFLNVKRQRVAKGELAPRSLQAYKRTALALARFFGEESRIEALISDDFKRYREHLSKGRELVAVTNEIRIAKIVFNFAYDHRIIPLPLPLKAWLEPPQAKAKRAENNLKPLRMLEADELRAILGTAGVQLRAMTLLGINCGFGNTDVATLPEAAIDLTAGWVDFPRPKTAVKRTCPLWPETVEAVRAALAKRPTATSEADFGLAFITKYGMRFVRSTDNGVQIDSIALEFGKLLRKLDLKRQGLNFYALRSSFETVASDSGDEVATSYIMGHAASSTDMAAVYRRKLFDARLQKTVDHVRQWLWPEGSEAAWIVADEIRKKEAAEKATANPGEPDKPKTPRKNKPAK
ncbi:MAG: Phage integrase family protein [Planctomycetaceae bacterium]|nr:Phage integrase family protein [Planctomycetaceae bacterium]